MKMHPISTHAAEQSLRATTLLALVSFCSGCTENTKDFDTKTGVNKTSPASDHTSVDAATDAEVTQQVTVFCGACHAVPMPDSFPKHAWYDEVRRGFNFYYDSSRKDLKPPRQASVVSWYQQRAPEQLAEPDQTEAGDSPLDFKLQITDVPVNSSELAAVSVVRPADSESNPSQFWVSDMRRGVVVHCDVNDPTKSRVLHIGSNPAGTCDVDLDQNGSPDLIVADLGSFLPEDHSKGQVLWLPDSKSSDAKSEPRVILDSIGRVADVQPADMDNDGDQDLVVAEFGWHKTGGIHVVFNDLSPTGERTFRNLRVDSRPGTIHVPVTDLDGDGRQDFVALISQEHEVIEAFLNRESASDTTRQTAPSPQRWLIYPSLLHGQIQTPSPGRYRIRVQLSGLASFNGRLPRLSLWNSSLKRAEVGQDVLAAEDAPTVIEFESFLPQGSFQLINEAPGKLDDGPTPSSTPKLLTRVNDYRPSPIGYKLFLEDGRPVFPLLLVDWYECEGPIVPEADLRKREGFFPASISSRSPLDAQELEEQQRDVRECLSRFMARAWRRPPMTAEVDRFMELFDSERKSGEHPRTAYLAAMAGVLTSRNFYYIVEGSADAQRERINDWELASRLSYFLWSSLPDDELFELAARGELHQLEVLRQQVQRMLADSKSSRFVEAFPQQWLQLHRVGQFPPDPELYPDYDMWLEQSMIRETTGVFGEVFSQNLSIREFLSSDWTVMNSRLGMHYGIDMPAKAGFHRVTLAPDDHRGGLLTHASVLSLTSDGTRHRPVHRGVWVSEAIFGRTPPPPPPNVEPLEPTPSDKPKATIRDQLEAHATHATCASCHQKIDPLGFAFDNYDAVGRWRTQEKIAGGLGDDPSVSACGTFPDGRSYQNPEEFKQLLAGDLDRFAVAFVEQLATFALRRVMTIDDRAQIKTIAEASKHDGYRLRTVIEQLVMSELFLKR